MIKLQTLKNKLQRLEIELRFLADCSSKATLFGIIEKILMLEVKIERIKKLEKMEATKAYLQSILAIESEPVSKELSGFVMPFGKYKDLILEDIPMEYLKWGRDNLDRPDIVEIFSQEYDKRATVPQPKEPKELDYSELKDTRSESRKPLYIITERDNRNREIVFAYAYSRKEMKEKVFQNQDRDLSNILKMYIDKNLEFITSKDNVKYISKAFIFSNKYATADGVLDENPPKGYKSLKPISIF